MRLHVVKSLGVARQLLARLAESLRDEAVDPSPPDSKQSSKKVAAPVAAQVPQVADLWDVAELRLDLGLTCAVFTGLEGEVSKETRDILTAFFGWRCGVLVGSVFVRFLPSWTPTDHCQEFLDDNCERRLDTEWFSCLFLIGSTLM